MGGQCHCGDITFVLEEKPTWVGECHCRDCQRISGTTSMVMAAFSRRGYVIVTGEPVRYQSSLLVERTFCGRCGSSLSYFHSDYPDSIEIPIGVLNDLSLVPTEVHIWTSDKPSWCVIADTVPQYEGDQK